MVLKDILKVKGTAIFSIVPGATLEDVVRLLVQHRVGSLLVCERDATAGEQLLGIITERDILHACAAGKRPLAEQVVAEVMTKTLITASPEDSVEDVMGLMTSRRIRHLPVLSEGRLVGLVSIGDVVKSQHDRLAMENQFMRDYIRS